MTGAVNTIGQSKRGGGDRSSRPALRQARENEQKDLSLWVKGATTSRWRRRASVLHRQLCLARKDSIRASQIYKYWPETCQTTTAEPKCWLEYFCRKEASMLYWAAVFLVISIIAAALGFGGIAGAAAGIAKILFGIFLVLFILFLIIGWRAGRAIM